MVLLKNELPRRTFEMCSKIDCKILIDFIRITPETSQLVIGFKNMLNRELVCMYKQNQTTMKFITKITAGLCLIAGSVGTTKACDLSGFTLNNVSNLGNNRYKLDLTFCAGSGIGNSRYGADQGTTFFAFYMSMNAKVDTFSHDTLRSPLTGDAFKGYKLIDSTFNSVPYYASTLFYLDPNYTSVWACITGGCGPVQSVCRTISIYTIGLPDTVWLRGMEAGGNILGGCTDLKVYPRCFGNTPSVSAGNNQTVYLSSSFNCVTLNSSVSGGSGTYFYKWSTGETTSGITVCPTTQKTYSLKVTDGNFCSSMASVIVYTSCSKTSLSANAGNDKVLYKGYGATCATLTGSASAGSGSYTYKWSHGPTTAQVSVCPSATTVYSLIVTDAYGCKDTDYVTVTVKDVRCGKKLTNVEMCYNNKTLCVTPSNVSYYLQRGGTIGACGSGPVAMNNSEIQKSALTVFPNPARETVKIALTGAGKFIIVITDLSGRTLLSKNVEGYADGNDFITEINLTNMLPGIYVVKVTTENGTQLAQPFVTQ